MLFNSPLSSEKANLLISLLELSDQSHVIDVGCGTGEFLSRVLETYPAKGVGVDILSESLEQAQANAKRKSVSDRIEFHESDIQKFEATKLFDCGICMGSSHAYSMGEPAYRETLQGLGSLIRPDGLLLIGESFWTVDPKKEYLDFIGDPVGTYRSHQENVELAVEMGFLPLYATTSTLDEWDDFEWRHHMRIEKRAEESPDDVELGKRREFGRRWRAAYLKWGRGTMGFGFYLFKKP
ncbi:MAG: methyltransferase domain-containing protein [Verrucomicrobiales bacterium]|nr:methyltransferase domain-containing protein [Verrucomicrobiales bacterium]